MNTEHENKLADELLNWYWANKDKINSNKKFWAQNSLGYAISSIVKEQNRWKNAPRGAKHKKFPEKKTLEATNDNEFDF